MKKLYNIMKGMKKMLKIENNAKDEKRQKEYRIVCIFNGGTPFVQNVYKSIYEAKAKLNEMISTEKLRNRMFYVDNDFYENEYQLILTQIKYYKIEEREVAKWSSYHEENENTKASPKQRRTSNIVAFIKNS